MSKTLLLLFFAFSVAAFGAERSKEQDNIKCLTQAIYFESRGETLQGKIAVGNVVLNRYMSGNYRTVCEVIRQRGQYGWANKPNKVREKNVWVVCERLADRMIHGEIPDNTHGSTFFKEKTSRKKWSRGLSYTGKIGNHLFFKEPDI